jgi:hypothetical protein
MSVTPLSFKGSFWPVTQVMGLLCGMTASIDVANAQSAGGSILYRLNPDSNFQRGCFPPCMCPVMLTEPVSGTFLLTPGVASGFSTIFTVTEVRWSIANNGTNRSVTGSGTYYLGGEPAPQQELSLYLQIDGGDVEHFDSGLVTNSLSFPKIIVSISTNHQYCLDTVFEVDASPTRVPQLYVSLTATNTVLVTWAVSADTFVLQENSDLSTANWTAVTNTPTVIGQQNQVLLPLGPGNRCYRLQPGGD